LNRLPAIALLLLAPGAASAQAPPRHALPRPSTDEASVSGLSTPHPAVVRVVVPQRDGTSYGSGTLVDVQGQYGLVITNWHVVSEAAAPPFVLFPDGFRSSATIVKTDRDWDLAALAIWKPNSEPVPLSADPPRPGDWLAIAGYGPGPYRAAAGRCTQYVAPGMQLPMDMVELSAAARQGDSGGPIFNQRGELAGVLFGAGHGHTAGSYSGRVEKFLASVVPADGPDAIDPEMIADYPAGSAPADWLAANGEWTSIQDERTAEARQTAAFEPANPKGVSARSLPGQAASVPRQPAYSANSAAACSEVLTWRDVAGQTRAEQVKTLLAAIGALGLVLHGARLFGRR